MIKGITILLFLSSCTVSRVASYTITLNGSGSHAADGQQLIHVQWRDINGKAVIQNPNALVTTAIVRQATIFELWGQQTDGQAAKDSMRVY